MSILSAYRSVSGTRPIHHRRLAAAVLVGALSVAGCGRIVPVTNSAGDSGSTTTTVAPAAPSTTMPDLRPPAEMSDGEWSAWALPLLVGPAAADDGDFTVDDVIGLLDGGRTRVEVALDLTDTQATSSHTLSVAVSRALPVPAEVAAAHARGALTTGEAMARVFAADADWDMPRGAFELAWMTLAGEDLTENGWLAINSWVEHGLDPEADVYGWLTAGIDNKPGALGQTGSDAAITRAVLADLDHLVDGDTMDLAVELYRLTGSGSVVRAVVLAGALTPETVDQFATEIGPGGITLDADEAPEAPTTTAPPAPDVAVPAEPAAPVEGAPTVLLASDPAPAHVVPAGPKTWTAEMAVGS